MVQPLLDHVVINVAAQLDEASALYRRLGFQLTARGHHSLGSSNHLAVFGDNYLELLGYEPGNDGQRQDLWQAPLGLTGLVWKTQDADAVFHHLQQRDLAGDPPAAFFRPVQLPDGQNREAHFRTVRLRPALIPNGRSFFCQHATPEAVWQPDWQVHPNSVSAISGVVIAAQQPAAASEVYQALFGASSIQPAGEGTWVLQAGEVQVLFASPQYTVPRFGPLPAGYDGSPRMSALSFHSTNLANTQASLQAGGIPYHTHAGDVLVHADQGFNVALRFHH